MTSLFFGLSKTYVGISQDILLDKLNGYSIRAESNLWFKTYLSNHLQFVKIKETDCNNSLKAVTFIMQESEAWCSARLVSRAISIFVTYK
jgi:phosphoribosyl-AMP cyclohydrolase